MEKRLLNIKELSEYLNVSRHTLYSWVNRGRVPYIKLNGTLRFEVAAIDKWIEENKSDPLKGHIESLKL